ncbi:MAG: flagellar hook-basal body complex protein FliE [Geobacteraceae bacterium GWC2_58_44]|nr:MAG: flagellar hook-basal body complex protein FliE [Geobacteraceae bacterium GWC2_58_44]HBG04981.1 flagellar hook-basal body complex protein FliE [Geobacter sp.]
MQISAISNVSGLSEAFPMKPAAGAVQNPTLGFGKLMEDMVGKVSELQANADQSIRGLATGQSQGLHEVMLAVEKASISFQMMTQVRNKAVEAYQEIMRMPV